MIYYIYISKDKLTFMEGETMLEKIKFSYEVAEKQNELFTSHNI